MANNVLYRFEIGEAAGGTDNKAIVMNLRKEIYNEFKGILGMTEIEPENIKESDQVMTIEQATAGFYVVAVKVSYKKGKSKGDTKSQTGTVFVPRDKIEEALAPSGLISKKYSGNKIIRVRQVRKRSYTY